jgi:hypothetical protein
MRSLSKNSIVKLSELPKEYSAKIAKLGKDIIFNLQMCLTNLLKNLISLTMDKHLKNSLLTT